MKTDTFLPYSALNHLLNSALSYHKSKQLLRQTQASFVDVLPRIPLPERAIADAERGQQFYIGGYAENAFFLEEQNINIFHIAAQANYNTGSYIYSFLWLHDYLHNPTHITHAHAQFLLETYCDFPILSCYLSYNPQLIAKRLLAIVCTSTYVTAPFKAKPKATDQRHAYNTSQQDDHRSSVLFHRTAKSSAENYIADIHPDMCNKILLKKLGYRFSKELQMLDAILKQSSNTPYLLEIWLAKLAIALALNFTREYILAVQNACEKACQSELTQDGLHCSRSPQYAAEILHLMHFVEKIYARTHTAVPPFLSQAIETLTQTLAFLHLPDGNLAHFNSIQSLTKYASITLRKYTPLNTKKTRLQNYYRITSRELYLIMDGGCNHPLYSQHTHIQPLAIEICDAHTPLFVNCGNDARLNAEWQDALKQSAAANCIHISTQHEHDNIIKKNRLLKLVNTIINRWRFYDKSLIDKPKIPKPTVTLYENDDKTILKAQYKECKRPHNLSVTRNIILYQHDTLIEGEDTVYATLSWFHKIRKLWYKKHYTMKVESRFHCHKSLRITQKDSHNILLETSQGIQYLFTVQTCTPHIEASVYVEDGVIHNTKQIYITQEMTGDFCHFNWQLRRC